jgi:hypothetical protein
MTQPSRAAAANKRYPQQPADVSGAQFYQQPDQNSQAAQSQGANAVNFYNRNATGGIQS